MTVHDWWVISPELAVAGLAILVVLLDLLLRDKRLLVGIAVAGRIGAGDGRRGARPAGSVPVGPFR